MATASAEEMETFQRLSDQYQADLPGPLVGNKLPLSVLVTEYAQADPTFVVKTTALAATHSAYRPIKGDGQCGWRGVVFSYFEILLQSGDLGLVMQEMTRLQSFEQNMRIVGIDYDIIVDMFDYTWELFEDIRQAVERKDKDEAVLLRSLNDENKSNSIVYHFKMMTSAFMQLQAHRYEAFIPDMTVQEYCLQRIDPTNQEIDHIGLQALTDAVIAPAGIALEVSYLDRSAGEEVTPHRFVPDARGWPTIRLIYRPGHYDVIYKDNRPVQVFLQSSQSLDFPTVSQVSLPAGDPDLHAFMFPNATLIPETQPPEQSQSPAGAGNYIRQPAFYPYDSPPAQSPGMPHDSYHLRQSPLLAEPQVYAPNLQISPSPQSPLPPTPRSTSLSSASTSKPNEPQIRYNENVFNYSLQRHESIPLDPSTFGSSALSPAHFRNSDFQPQMWNPEEGYGKP